MRKIQDTTNLITGERYTDSRDYFREVLKLEVTDKGTVVHYIDDRGLTSKCSQTAFEKWVSAWHASFLGLKPETEDLNGEHE